MNRDIKNVSGYALRSWWVALGLSLLVACGGGGGDSAAIPVSGESSTGTDGGSGSIGITIGDNPVEDFDEILITVSRVELIGGDNEEPVVLSDNDVEFDLLALDAATELLVAADNVPAGDYAKIRLHLDSISLVRHGGEPVEAQLRANGKLDLNPRGSFSIVDGGAIVVRLDIDAERSFQAVEAPPGTIGFRPVVFVKILGDGDLRRITFLSGDVRLLGERDDAFDLCDVRPLTGPGNRMMDDCRRVDLAANAALFDSSAEPIEFSGITDGDRAIVGGRVLVVDGQIGFEALLLHRGDRQDFKRITGTITEGIIDGSFALSGEGDDETSGLAVTVQPGALLFDQDGELLETDVLVTGTDVRVMGHLIAAEGEGSAQFLATAIAVDSSDAVEEASATGTVTAFADGRLDLELADGGGEACVRVNADTEIFVSEMDDDAVTSRDGTGEDLEVGASGEARGELGDDDCIVATEIVVEL